jgi:N-acetylmuramoyl-L-alanine amidase
MSKVCIDAGHYGKYNASPANKAYYESVRMWRLHELLAAELRKRGVTVVVTRSNQAADLSLISRGKKAKGCDLFLSLHSNAVGSGVNESVDYPVAYVLRPNARTSIDEKAAEIGLILAKVVQATMDTTQPARTATRAASGDRDGNGVKDDEYYGVLEGARQMGVPAVILEHSFHTQTRATNWLLQDANLQRLAVAEADAIAAWLGAKAPTQTGSTSLPYQVRVSITDLNIRSGPGTGYAKKGYIKPSVYTITAEASGKGASKWLKLKSGAGYISADFVKRV